MPFFIDPNRRRVVVRPDGDGAKPSRPSVCRVASAGLERETAHLGTHRGKSCGIAHSESSLFQGVLWGLVWGALGKGVSERRCNRNLV